MEREKSVMSAELIDLIQRVWNWLILVDRRRFKDEDWKGVPEWDLDSSMAEDEYRKEGWISAEETWNQPV